MIVVEAFKQSKTKNEELADIFDDEEFGETEFIRQAEWSIADMVR
jgi:hypothetical protein